MSLGAAIIYGRMAGSLIDRKLRHLFSIIDANNDGVLELEDWVQCGNEAARACGCEHESREANALRDANTGFWNEVLLPMDTDGDGRVSLDEYLEGVRHRILDNPEGREILRRVNECFFNVADTDGDGRITRQEFCTTMSASYRIPESEMSGVYDELDPSGGNFTRDTSYRAIQEFFLSDDPRAPGNNFFGRI